ncbi:MAG: hypothetical protein QM790_15150 [Nibricoccus sp.]
MPSSPHAASGRRIRLFHFNFWAGPLQDAGAFVDQLPGMDLSAKVANANDPEMLRMARLDCDWHGAITHVLSVIAHRDLEFLPTRVLGIQGVLDLARAVRPVDEEWWLIFQGQEPQKLAGALSKLLPFLARNGVKVFFYAFDEASRTMPCFKDLAPHLNVFIHDEEPLDAQGRALLSPRARVIHRSWVANLVPFLIPFHQQPDEKILFLGSKLGLTDHRKRQIAHLQKKFGDRFVAIHDHSVNVKELGSLNRFKVGLCPEGRKFTTPAMSATHTDRPFWSGCLGMVPVSEDSKTGGRLESQASAGLLLRYAHGDLDALVAACEQALAMPNDARRRIYDHFNRYETIGTVIADAIAETP